MVLNQIVKGTPDPVTASGHLKWLITAPTDDSDAKAKLNAFLDYLDSTRLEAQRKGSWPENGRLRIFASLFWHAQAPERWPVCFDAARTALQTSGAYSDDDLSIPDDYLAFRRSYLELTDALGITFWELEALIRWIGGDRPTPKPVAPNIETPVDRPTRRIWLISLGPRSMYWDEFHREGIIAIGWDYLGDLRQYADIGTIRDKIREERETDENPINDGLACWQFVHDMREGDGVFVIKGQYGILGYGVVTSDYRYEEYRPYPNVRSVRWIKRGDWTLKDRFSPKALTEVTPYEEWLQGLRAIVGISAEDVAIETSAYAPKRLPYDLDSAISDLFLSADRISEMVELCRRKKNLILQGPPGVGKTFVATRLAYLLIGAKDDSRVERVQFHPSYSYEDFVQGLRPAEGGGFERTDGPFLRFARRAVEDPDHAYVLVIDEINRGNISKILGELLSLIEADKREAMYGVTLAYSRDGESRFHLPPNLFLIGTMNTADRALAFVDYALRRRFAFFDIAPAFSSDRFEEDLRRRGVGDELRKTIVDRMSALNNRIREDKTLGDGFCVGHSYFCQAEGPFDLDWFRQIVRYEIVPLLREYWFDNTSGWESERDRLLGE